MQQLIGVVLLISRKVKAYLKAGFFERNTASYGGGAIDINEARSLLLKNCTFEGNMVKILAEKETFGGAIDINETRSLLLKNCTFEGNMVKSLAEKETFGGAIISDDM